MHRDAAAGEHGSEDTPNQADGRYPTCAFERCLCIGRAILELAGDAKVRTGAVIDYVGRDPTSRSVLAAIDCAAEYGLTEGSGDADYLRLTPEGRVAADGPGTSRPQRRAAFRLSIQRVPAFNYLYEHYRGQRLPNPQRITKVLRLGPIPVDSPRVCTDRFLANARFLGLVRVVPATTPWLRLAVFR